MLLFTAAIQQNTNIPFNKMLSNIINIDDDDSCDSDRARRFLN